MGISRALGFACCVLTFFLIAPVSAGASFKPEDTPEFCTFAEGDLGRYIVVFHDWVEDPTGLAHEQAEKYGGNLGHIYTSALKGYAAEFLPQSATALQAEPTVKYVEIDRFIWMESDEGIDRWYSCPAAPSLGPVPPITPDPPEEPEGDGSGEEPPPDFAPPLPPFDDGSEETIPTLLSTQTTQFETGQQQVEEPTSHRRPLGQRRGCKKRKGRGQAPSLARCPKRVG